MLGAAWYGQGLRLLDISNARDVRQVGYYRVTGTGDGQPVLELVGHGVPHRSPQGRPRLPVRHEPRRRGPADEEGRQRLAADEVRHGAERASAIRSPPSRSAGSPRTSATPASATSARCSPDLRDPRGAAPRGAPSGQPALGAQLVQVRLERPARREPQPLGHAVPGGVDAARPRRAAPASSAATIRRSRSSRCATYSSSLASGVVDLGPVAGVEPLQPERAQPPQAVEVRRRARRRPAAMKDAADAEHGVAGERVARPATNTRWSARMAGHVVAR